MKKLIIAIATLLMLTMTISASFTSYAGTAGAKPQKYSSWSASTAKKISNAAAKKKLTINAKQFTAFSPAIRDAMIERPDVQVTVKWTDNGEAKKFVILSGTDVSKVFDENGYAGFVYLQNYFGEKGNTEQAKAIRTRKGEIDNVVTVLGLKSYAGNTAEFNAYTYYQKYEDLRVAIGPDGDKLLEHYNTHGKAEGRVAK